MNDIDWNDAGFLKRLAEAVDVGVAESAAVGADAAVRSFGRDHGGVPSAPGGPPNSQSGQLRNSIVYVTPKALGTPGRAAFGSNLIYARIMEFGGVIRATRAKALPVPINPAAKRMLRRANGQSLRTFNLTMVKRKGDSPLLVEKTATGREKKNGAVFVLKRSITIKPRPYLSTALKTAAADMERAFVQAAKSHLGF